MTSATARTGYSVRRVHASSTAQLRFDDLMARAWRVRRSTCWLLSGLAVASSVWAFLFVTDFAMEILTIVGSASLAVCLWGMRSENRIPIFPMLVVQQAVVLGLPIVRRSATVMNFAPELTSTAAWIFALFCGAMTVGWLIAKTGKSGSASRFGFALSSGLDSNTHVFSIGIVLMLVGLTMRTTTYLFPEYFFSGWFAPFYPVYRSLESAAELGGSFVAALFLGLGSGGRARAIFY